MICVYVAGAYSANNVTTILNNMRVGMRAGTEVFLSGYAAFTPWLDFHYQLMLRDNENLEVKDYYEYSLSWLRKSDAILVLPNSENSVGTQKEIEVAKELKIPIFYNLEDLKKVFPVKK